ncbi:ABC transporter substrate-binding protein [Natronosporangium hydrolyticum]|uniref:ABC transporter substrate-binding protein n=1 Tax=Natronosporangium hydrolyticum TaxID=2811111 RepID=A0A895YDM9_9ACTN|nr:ABC transporter substrate-binding protein [Natronosporangium hydrolyticum]QSB15887.1 ABC transporter substrate-binding protein [Natronosporangium hydrolyticum]
MSDDPRHPLPPHLISRRAMLRGAGLLGLGVSASSLLAACGIAADGDEGDDEPSTGGTLTLGIDATSAVNDPAFYTSLGDWMAVDCICRGLTFISFETNEPQPDLAESWEISDDGLTYTFTLRRDITFHDGTEFTADDVLASLGRQFDPDDPTLPEGASRPLASLGANVVSLSAVDDHTVELVLERPDATVLNRLSDIGGRIISKAALDEYGVDIGRNLVGTGPFQFSSATAGQQVVLTAFEDFRLGRPLIDRLVLQQVQDPSTIVSSLLSGDLSATQFTPYSSIEQLRADDSVTFHETPFSFDAMMMIDARRIPELEVRQAINLAIDREAIIEQAFFGVAAAPDGYTIPPSQNGYDPSLADLSRFDPDEARQLLEAAGAVGREVALMAASDSWHPRAAQIVAQNLTDVGLTVISDSVDPATYFSRLLDPDDRYHELMIWERNSYIPDPDNMIGALALPSGVYGDFTSGFNTLDGAEEFADLLDQAKNLPDGDERTELYSDIQRRFAEEYMVLSMLAYSANPVSSGANVEGMNVDALANHRCFMENASV